ncbi:hypothetical protein [Streptomyces lydicus]|uniref:hypothetical protein n=1 Tax=Streptomyces lydicus TaxID=47763 RepID=UPI0037B260C8
MPGTRQRSPHVRRALDASRFRALYQRHAARFQILPALLGGGGWLLVDFLI